jgi:SAM-dependent methyltransferase
MNADNPSRRGAAVIDRKPLKREACSSRGTRSRLSVASPAGPRRQRLASWDEPTHDRPSGAGNWGISGYIGIDGSKTPFADNAQTWRHGEIFGRPRHRGRTLLRLSAADISVWGVRTMPMNHVLNRSRRLANAALSRISRRRRATHKYAGEVAWWRKELEQLKRWYDGEIDWCCIPPPTREQVRHVSPIEVTNAVVTVHHIVPHYRTVLLIKEDEFVGKRVLEVGCGPLAPIMQFRDCERHGLDPLIESYIRGGWPLYDYGITFVNARAESMPYADSYFDAVISVNALDHVDDFTQVASEIQRVLKVGGRLYFEVEYHEPRPLEPQRINDDVVRASFTSCVMDKICERSGSEKYDLVANRFGLRPDGTGQYTDDGRLAVWHGIRTSGL